MGPSDVHEAFSRGEMTRQMFHKFNDIHEIPLCPSQMIRCNESNIRFHSNEGTNAFRTRYLTSNEANFSSHKIQHDVIIHNAWQDLAFRQMHLNKMSPNNDYPILYERDSTVYVKLK